MWNEKLSDYHIYLKSTDIILPYFYCIYSDRQAWENSVDPYETPQNVASHQGLHCLPLIKQFLDITSGSKLYLFRF